MEKKAPQEEGRMEKKRVRHTTVGELERPFTILEEEGAGTNICPQRSQMQALQCQCGFHWKPCPSPQIFISQIYPKSLHGQLYLTDAFLMMFAFPKILRIFWSLSEVFTLLEALVNHTIPFLGFPWHTVSWISFFFSLPSFLLLP